MLKLKYAKVVRPRTRQTGEVREYQEYRGTRRTIRDVTTPRKIQLYRWWFRYLQLALELESYGYAFVERKRIAGTKKKKGYFRPVNRKVVVNRKKYEGWDLDQILDLNFDKWWKGHSHLFVESPNHVREILDPKDMNQNDHNRHFEVDTRMSVEENVRRLREELRTTSKRRRTEWFSKWIPTGEVRQEKLLNSYNALILSLQGKTTEQIITSGLFRKSKGNEVGLFYWVDKHDGVRKSMEKNSKQQSDALRDLLRPARRWVLMAADGYFAKHPRNKKYFGD